jgi:NADH-quinone oxidoreductase subunit L
MVTAGVYMIGRNAVLFSHAPETLTVVAVIGVATALMAGLIGLVQNDIKRVLAYSTVSQLGYMFLAMGVGAYGAGIFHLYTHAFFKALLFLGSGAVIHALAGEQDLRRMGGLKKDLPLTYWTFLIGAIAISGVPGFAGFFSKDEILARTFEGGHTVLWGIGLFTSLLTAIYMFRLVFMAFHGPSPKASHSDSPSATASQVGPSSTGHEHAPSFAASAPQAHAHADTAAAAHQPHGHLHDAPGPMAIALIALAIGSVLAGYVSLGGRFEHFLEPSFGIEVHEASDSSVELTLTIVSSLIAFAGIGIAAYFFLKNCQAAAMMAERFAGVRRLLVNKFYIDEIYDAAIVQPIRIISEEGLWKTIDVHVIDAAVNGVADTVGGMSEMLRRLQTGSVRTYAASLFAGVVFILGYYLWR